MQVEGRHDTFAIRCEDCDNADLNREPAETRLEDFRVQCPSCGGTAAVENDGGIVKAYATGDADITVTPV